MNGDETTTNMDTSAGPRKTSRLPKTMEERTPEEQHRVDAIDLQCLNLSINMLERVNSVIDILIGYRASADICHADI
jgi:hypothetical protein